MKRKNKKLKIIVGGAVALIFIAAVLWIAWGNTALELNTYTISSTRLPSAFDGYRIAHVSDLHNAQMGKDNEKLLTMLRQAKPDMIAMTGDMIDSQRTDIDVALEFILKAVEIAPCYFVKGNHEFGTPFYIKLKQGMEKAGVVILEDQRVELNRGDDSVALLGLNDPAHAGSRLGDSLTATNIMLAYLGVQSDEYTILLSHRPEPFPVYVSNGVDLVLSGHAHGGQFRLPFVGGLFAPDQGVFPEYDAGRYTEGNTNMIVSRGIGNSAFPFRINNRPEVILIELRCEK